MRLTDYQITAIVGAVQSSFGDAARTYLFGSRLDDSIKGGDIDLFVDLPVVDDAVVHHSCQALAKMYRLLGEQRIDLVVRHPGLEDQSIFQEALKHGELLSPGVTVQDAGIRTFAQ